MFPIQIFCAVLVVCATGISTAAISYPPTRKCDASDMHHGVKVADPYRWLEDDNAVETKQWVKAQNKVTDAYLAAIPQREVIRKRLEDLWNFERIGAPRQFGKYWFHSYNSGLQNQSVIMVAESENGESRVLLDPNAFSEDGTVSLAAASASEDGKYYAYAISSGGSDWREIKVRDVASGLDLEDHLKWVKFSGISWRKDGSGFFYSCYDAPSEDGKMTLKNEFQKLYFHKLGESQEKDELVCDSKEHPQRGFGGYVTEDGRFLIIHVGEGTNPNNRVYYKDLKTGGEIVKLLDEADASYDFLGNDGGLFYFHTDLQAPLGKVISIDIEKPHRANWKTLISETREKLEDVSLAGNTFFCKYLRDAKSAILCHQLDGILLRTLNLPGIGSAGGFHGRRTEKDTFFVFTSFTEPGSIYKLDIESGEYRLWRKSAVKFDSSPFETRQVFATSKDGTRVPMFITCRKGLKLDGSHPTLLYGYGGFDSSLTPFFSVPVAAWLERGGVYVVANIRGGGEYGREWHLAGTKLRKQNTFDDFISCAEWLQQNGYTSRKKLAIQGGSNGGLLVGACMTQRPELFAAAIPQVGVMDMLRYQKFTIGWAWEEDYGDPADKDTFKTLMSYSPYHNLKPGTRYPATLVTTADHDDRVVPAHSFKFAARLQACQAQGSPPVLIHVETSAGHGAGTALTKMIDLTTCIQAFLVKNLHMN